jgi:hypothetical protein
LVRCPFGGAGRRGGFCRDLAGHTPPSHARGDVTRAVRAGRV